MSENKKKLLCERRAGSPGQRCCRVSRAGTPVPPSRRLRVRTACACLYPAVRLSQGTREGCLAGWVDEAVVFQVIYPHGIAQSQASSHRRRLWQNRVGRSFQKRYHLSFDCSFRGKMKYHAFLGDFKAPEICIGKRPWNKHLLEGRGGWVVVVHRPAGQSIGSRGCFHLWLFRCPMPGVVFQGDDAEQEDSWGIK